MREKQLNIRLNDEETLRLEFVTKHHGLNGANLFRLLLKREEDAIRLALASHPAAEGREHRIARAQLGQATGASFACPTYFRAGIRAASEGGTKGYADAAWHLAIHLSDYVESEAAQKALEDAVDKGADAVIDWIRLYLPRCYQLVPANRLKAFAKGIEGALAENRVL